MIKETVSYYMPFELDDYFQFMKYQVFLELHFYSHSSYGYDRFACRKQHDLSWLVGFQFNQIPLIMLLQDYMAF